LIGAHFFYASWAYNFLFYDPSLLLQDYKKRNLFELWSIYFWCMDGMFCVTLGVGVSVYMWVYVILIMEAWKDSNKGHNNLAKLNESQASICRRFGHWYRHMALVGNITIEELALFYFQKEIVWDFHHTLRQRRLTLSHHIILVNTLDLVISICFPRGFISGSCSQNIPTSSKRHRARRYALGSCKVLTYQPFIISKVRV
jgi:hypothetical protein